MLPPDSPFREAEVLNDGDTLAHSSPPFVGDGKRNGNSVDWQLTNVNKENDGVSVFLLSTHHAPHALKTQTSSVWVSTQLIEQCLVHFRDSLLLAREYGQKSESEGPQLRMHLLTVHKCERIGEVAEVSNSTATEAQLYEHLLRDDNEFRCLLSESPRYRQILQDMGHLARGLTLPVELFRHRHNWLFVHEDVQLNLADRLRHYRMVVRRSPPATLVERLWHDLWTLLGAMWRQRRRLLGVYAEGLLPVDLCGDASKLPPSAASPPSECAAYREKQKRYRSQPDDSYAFGPLLPHRVGISTGRHHVIRWPLLSILRSLRVRVVSESALPMSKGTTSAPTLGSLYKECGGATVGLDGVHNPVNAARAPHNAMFFDTVTEDLDSCRVPYLSPEWYVRIRKCTGGHSCEWQSNTVAHSFSDDAWNIAVLTVEYMLAGFPLDKSCCGHPDLHTPRTSSIFDDILRSLVVHHHMPLHVTHNFIYAALHELSLLSSNQKEAMEENEIGASEPTPQLLAKEWYRFLRDTYGEMATSILSDVAQSGLQWTRQDRWKAFQAVHALFWREEGEEEEKERTSSGDVDMSVSFNSTSDTSQQVLDNLLIPFVPLNPTLCSAANKSSAAIHFPRHLTHKHAARGVQQDEGERVDVSMSSLHRQLKTWRQSIQRHAMIDGGCRKNSEAKQTIVFKRFVQIVRRILQLQQGNGGGTVRDPEKQPPYYAVQQQLLRGLTERGALFSHIVDVCKCVRPDTGRGSAEDDVLRVFAFSRAFLPLSDALSFLHSDVKLLTSFSPSATLVVHQLDSILGSRQAGASRVVGSPRVLTDHGGGSKIDDGEEEDLLKIVKTVIRSVDLSLEDQLGLVADLRQLISFPMSSARRASAVRRYLLREQARRGTVTVPIPATLRGEVWAALLLVTPDSVLRAETYYGLNTAHPTSYDRQLSVDIPRCHQYHQLMSSAEGHERLRRVLKAWMMLNPGLSYWQGLDSVSAILIAVSYADEPLVLAQLQQLTRSFIPHDVTSDAQQTRSMEWHFVQLAMLIRYCDPRLADHLEETCCGPELFAISWLLALMAHSLPFGKVCLLWDFLFVYSTIFPNCLLALCLAVIMQYRERLLKSDFSTCLTALSRVQGINVQEVLRDLVLILHNIPSGIVGLPSRTGERIGGGEPRPPVISRMRVQTLVQAFQCATRHGEKKVEDAWLSSGLFLVDLRETRVAVCGRDMFLDLEHGRQRETEERVVGALLFPLVSCQVSSDGASDTQQKLQERLAVQLASELLLQLKNRAMAAIPPKPATSTTEWISVDISQSPALRECVSAPHIVLFTYASTERESSTTELLAMELMRCGTPHISILAGGFVQLKREAPHLVVEVGVG
uniref:Putative GTPase activating protein n=1 Tax=Trypanosoma vivax (strain Y486) TaxID=1055687 RepID=G0U224_TRYVY|nr:putative GTPase activating protein, fragment [Trypanosoma vivax Y486]